MPDPSLLMLLDEVRGKTLRVLQDVSRDQARWAPAGLQNTILWHAGHSYIVVEWLTMKALGKPPEIPDGWFPIFSWESRPATVPAERWPSLTEVVAQLETQQQRLRALIGGLSEEQLAGPAAASPERPLRYAILHALHDEARHSGEISLLLKLQRVLGS